MSRVQKYIRKTGAARTPAKFGVKLTSIACVALVAGCASYQKNHFTVGEGPSDYRTQHPIVVSQDEVTTDVIVTKGMRGMSQRTYNAVTDFTLRFRRSGADIIRIIRPTGSHNAVAARLVAADMVEKMKGMGVPGSQIHMHDYHAANHGDAATIRLSFDAIDARVHGKCGQWQEDLIDTSENRNYGNFGCATQNNLAEMIANPEDLISPRGQSEIDATRRDNVIDDWRNDGSADLEPVLRNVL